VQPVQVEVPLKTIKHRNNILCCFLITLLVAGFPTVVFSTAYYVDSSSGDDNNDGLSVDTAWQTVHKVNNMMSQLPAGSDILFKRGEQFPSDSLYVTIGGTEADPVVIGAYGSGDKPVFISGADIVCSRQGLGHIKVQDIFFQSPGFRSAVSFAAENMNIRPGSHSGDNVYDVTFQRCIIGPTLYPHSTGSYACPGHAWNKDKQNKEKGLYVQDIYFKIECMIFRNSDCDR